MNSYLCVCACVLCFALTEFVLFGCLKGYKQEAITWTQHSSHTRAHTNTLAIYLMIVKLWQLYAVDRSITTSYKMELCFITWPLAVLYRLTSATDERYQM